MEEVEDRSIQLVITSPPYPMIEMWDEQFRRQNPKIGEALQQGDGSIAFEGMHVLLDRVWKECFRVLQTGGFLCINIGDATRTIGGEFQLFSNHTRITETCRSLGFTVLPLILWRKPTNAPNKFMGSGMLPAGAYVTLEHEYILIFRKGGKRVFLENEKHRRRESAFFWEERNQWFSDQWSLRGVRQEMTNGFEPAEGARLRSAAFPLELATRLVYMYSLRGDWVLDPFLGTGTTLVASAITGRNGIGYELEPALIEEARRNILQCIPLGERIVEERLENHRTFVRDRITQEKKIAYWNEALGVPVMTAQEEDLMLDRVSSIKEISEELSPLSFHVTMEPFNSPVFTGPES
jgi:DNA modification methylase